MKISELGEFGLIDLLAKIITDSTGKTPDLPPLTVGIGDDTAAWPGKTGAQLATIDSLIENTHFDLSSITWEELGWKSLAVNLSDIAAMGGIPEYALVSLGLPGDTDVEDVSALYRGMADIARQYHVNISGGDTCNSSLVMITVAVLGTATSEILRRSSAQAGDNTVPLNSEVGDRQRTTFSAHNRQRIRLALVSPHSMARLCRAIRQQGKVVGLASCGRYTLAPGCLGAVAQHDPRLLLFCQYAAGPIQYHGRALAVGLARASRVTRMVSAKSCFCVRK